jgi:uncharacterized protein YerC
MHNRTTRDQEEEQKETEIQKASIVSEHKFHVFLSDYCLRIVEQLPDSSTVSSPVAKPEDFNAPVKFAKDVCAISMMEDLSQLFYIYNMLRYCFAYNLYRQISNSNGHEPAESSDVDWYSEGIKRLFCSFKSIFPTISYILRSGLFAVAALLEQ